jgi:hypothetical protein
METKEKDSRKILIEEIIKMFNQDFGQFQTCADYIVKSRDNIEELNKKKLGEAYYYLLRMKLELERSVDLMTSPKS